MKNKRQIIQIDDSKCTGCGQCIITCAEGALALVDGKARLVNDVYCDGLGACLGECPEGALRIIERNADEFDEAAVEERLRALKATEQPEPAPMPRGCPSAAQKTFQPKAAAASGDTADIPSQLGHWPIKLQLVNPNAPFLKGKELLLAADCVGVAFPQLNAKWIAERGVMIGCPKFDDTDAAISKLIQILRAAEPLSLIVAHMEVPCCHGYIHVAKKAIELSGVDVPLRRIVVSCDGKILKAENIETANVAV